MATEVFRTIIEDGSGNYTTVALWEAGQQTDNVAADTYQVGEIQGTWTAAVAAATILGSTTDPTRYIELRCDAANYFDGDYDATKFRMSGSLDVRDDNVRVRGVQVNTGGGTSGFVTRINTALFDGCCAYQCNRGWTTFSAGVHLARNCAAIDCVDYGFFGTGAAECNNCSARGNGSYGFRAVEANNCIAAGNATGGFFAGVTGDYNASSAADAPGANSIDSATFTWTTATSALIGAADTSGVIGGGADLSADATLPVTVDIFGTARPATPTMGINEVAAGGGPAAVPRRSLLGVGF